MNQFNTQPQTTLETAETVEVWRKRLTFRAWHRGTREMDLLIGSFADRNVGRFGAVELRAFEDILTENDPDVYDWIIGVKPLPENLKSPVMEMLLQHRFCGV